jgi:hypoxanthine-DNA glycosylase
MEHTALSFKPVVSKDTKVLIIGSIPGIKSLNEQEYYAHPRNAFWSLMADLFQVDFSDYNSKLEFILNHQLGLWDALGYAKRVGSLDSKIYDEVFNDFKSLLETYPNIKYVLCNGGKSFNSFKRIVNEQDLEIEYFKLPSTSPAYTLSYEEKKIKVGNN